jgi:hypothetical protein
MWCIVSGERNYLNFEDCERTVMKLKIKIKINIFKTLNHLMVAYDYFHISSFHDLPDLFSFSG